MQLSVLCQIKQLEAFGWCHCPIIKTGKTAQTQHVERQRWIKVDPDISDLTTPTAGFCVAFICQCGCWAPIVSQSYYQWMNLDFFFLYSPGVPPAGASRLLWPIPTHLRPWRSRGSPRIAVQSTARWRWKVASLSGCAPLALQMWLRPDCRSAAVPNMDPCQVWLDCHFHIHLYCLWPAHCYMQWGRWKWDKKTRKVLVIFRHSKVFDLLSEAIPSFLPHFRRATLHLEVADTDNRMLLLTCACLQRGFTTFRMYCKLVVNVLLLQCKFGEQVLLLLLLLSPAARRSISAQPSALCTLQMPLFPKGDGAPQASSLS